MNEQRLVADDESALTAVEPYAGGQDAATIPAQDRMIVRTAGVRIDVDDVEAALKEVRAQASAVDGIVTDVQLSSQEDIPVYRYEAQGSLADGAALSGYVTVRVPADSYDAFLDSVRGIGEVVRQSESESDVTQQHIDLQAQLDNLKAQETRLREFFDQAKSVEDLLSIEQELTRVRSQIDSLEAQIAYLERQASMSTVTIELVGPVSVVRPQGEDWGFVRALTTAVRAFVGTINVLIVVFGGLLPVMILGLIAFYIVRFFVRKRRAKTLPAEES